DLLNVSPFYQQVVKGVIIVVAIIIDERKNRSDRRVNAADHPKLHRGTAPDSWGVWMPSPDPLQTPWQRYLDEVVQAGYRYSELGPYGYLPTDPGLVRDEYQKRGLTLTGGTVFAALHKGPPALERAKAACDAEMALIGPSG